MGIILLIGFFIIASLISSSSILGSFILFIYAIFAFSIYGSHLKNKENNKEDKEEEEKEKVIESETYEEVNDTLVNFYLFSQLNKNKEDGNFPNNNSAKMDFDDSGSWLEDDKYYDLMDEDDDKYLNN